MVVPVAVMLATIVLIWSDTPLWQEDLASLSPVSEDKKAAGSAVATEIGRSGCA